MKKVILVTGGNRGIGKEICKELAELGHTVLLGSRSKDNGVKAAKEMNGDVQVVQLDVSNDDSVKKAVAFTEKLTGRLDVLINNAGISIGSRGLSDLDIDNVKEIMETNFYGPMRMNHYFLPLLKKGKDPRIINVSSGMGQLSSLTGGYAGYSLSKAGLNAQTILLANELRGSIKVFAVSPGWVKTDMGGASASRTPEEGAETIIWLALEDIAESGKFYKDKEEISY